MPVMRIRLTGTRSTADALIARLHGLDKLERVEEVNDEMDTLRDDSSSSELPDDLGADIYRIEVETPHAKTLESVHNLVEITARDLDAAVEFVDRF